MFCSSVRSCAVVCGRVRSYAVVCGRVRLCPAGCSEPALPSRRCSLFTQAQTVIADFRAAGLRPSERTLNVLLHGLLAPRREGSLAGALEVFNEFSAGGGPVGLITYKCARRQSRAH